MTLQDHAESQYNLALAYRLGEGVEQDHKLAVEWFEKAAKQVTRRPGPNSLP